jgi:hypothetical protein
VGNLIMSRVFCGNIAGILCKPLLVTTKRTPQLTSPHPLSENRASKPDWRRWSHVTTLPVYVLNTLLEERAFVHVVGAYFMQTHSVRSQRTLLAEAGEHYCSPITLNSDID